MYREDFWRQRSEGTAGGNSVGERERERGTSEDASPPGLRGGTDVSLSLLQASPAQPSTATDRANRLEKWVKGES